MHKILLDGLTCNQSIMHMHQFFFNILLIPMHYYLRVGGSKVLQYFGNRRHNLAAPMLPDILQVLVAGFVPNTLRAHSQNSSF